MTEALAGLPALCEVPLASASDMRNSLQPVLHALNHNLDASDTDLDAARAAFASWRQDKWLDPRSNTSKPKESHGWTIEQYGLAGFSGMYAKKLHVPRVAASRQVMIWLLECAPGLPEDEPLSFCDLGAGTCAACLGARLALRDLAGEEQPFKTFPIDVASSSARFAAAFTAMTKCEKYGRSALLPGQEAWQYLTEEDPGVESLTRSLFSQLKSRGEAQPHIMLASFSLHYLKKDQRDAFFVYLASLLTRPLLLVIIKGVGNTQRPSQHVVRSVHFGLHYVVHRAEKHPRVIEAHACLVLPNDHLASVASREAAEPPPAPEPPAAAKPSKAKPPEVGSTTPPAPLPPLVIPESGLEPSDRWMLQTYATLQKRIRRQGLRTGVTYFEESWL